jgi:hypothetical protein
MLSPGVDTIEMGCQRSKIVIGRIYTHRNSTTVDEGCPVPSQKNESEIELPTTQLVYSKGYQTSPSRPYCEGGGFAQDEIVKPS